MQWIFLYNPILSKMVYDKWDKFPKRQKNLPPIEKKSLPARLKGF